MRKRLGNWKEILKIAWPLIIANSFWNLQMTIDRIFLGEYSTASLGAAMAVMGIFWTPMALLQQTANYVTTFVAQYLGAKEEQKIGPAVWQGIYLSIAGGLLFFVFILFSNPLFVWIGHAANVQQLEIEYFNAMCYSAIPMALVAAFSGFYTGLGKTQVIMWINGVGLFVNAILDYFIISGRMGAPALGIAGAGYATAIANCAGAVLGFFLVFTRVNQKKFGIWTGWHWNLDLMKRFIKYGVPSGLQWALEGLAFTVFLIVIGGVKNGEAALASSSIAVTLMMLSVLPSMGVAQAVMVLVGQHLGNKKPELAEGSTWDGVQVSLIYMFFIAISFLLVPNFYMGWFKNSEETALWFKVAEQVPTLLIFVALFTCFDSVYFNLSFALKGAGDTRFVSMAALIVPWPIMVLPTYLMRDWHGALFWSWGAATIYSITISFTLFVRFLGGKWKSMSVIH